MRWPRCSRVTSKWPSVDGPAAQHTSSARNSTGSPSCSRSQVSRSSMTTAPIQPAISALESTSRILGYAARDERRYTAVIADASGSTARRSFPTASSVVGRSGQIRRGGDRTAYRAGASTLSGVDSRRRTHEGSAVGRGQNSDHTIASMTRATFLSRGPRQPMSANAAKFESIGSASACGSWARSGSVSAAGGARFTAT